MRTLILMRHAKSSYPPGVDDQDRPLSARGQGDARAAAQWLAATYPHVDEVVLSPARRVQETWELIRRSLSVSDVRVDTRIYDDWGRDLRRVIADLAPASRIGLLIGHNPGMEDIARNLTGPVALAERERMEEKFPTSAIAVVRWSGAWGSPEDAELLTFAVPRG
jgi:phosphohistidine phosphatase